ncbi:MAG: DUF1816 domain-containing protein [Xenococcaceae cyanobacterium]
MRRITCICGKIVSIQPLNGGREVNSQTSSELPWWVEISTAQPRCTYYFGPFDSAKEAQFYQPGYIEDLQEEGAEGIIVQIKQCQPKILTIF